MMIGLAGTLVDPHAGDLCLDMDSGQPAPCFGDRTNLLCLQSPSGGQQGKCGTFADQSQATPVPILNLGDALQRAPNWGDTIAGAVVFGSRVQGSGGQSYSGCDDLISAAGYDCHGFGSYAIYTRTNQPNPNNPGGTPQQLGLTPQQASYLIQQGIIAPITRMDQQIQVIPTAGAPAYGPGTPYQTFNSFLQNGLPQAAALPSAAYQVAAAPMPTPLTSGEWIPPNLTAPGAAPQPGPSPTPSASQPGGMIPGASTPTGPAAYASTGGTGAGVPAATSTDLIPGVPNTALYVGLAAVLLLAVLK